ncbi:MAG: protease complex subunit PrcB family protein [Clostridia bacterium]|nr:protease complex subunit PrcB family protein [Clostridia bacterium]
MQLVPRRIRAWGKVLGLVCLSSLMALGLTGDIPCGFGTPSPTPDLETWVEKLKSQEGVFVREESNCRIVLVTMGARPTGGYSIKVEKVRRTQDAWIIEVTTHVPGPHDVVTQVITYPYQLIRIPKDGLKIEVYEKTERGLIMKGLSRS